MIYDTIIVGAGTAGCVLANRLSEKSTHNVMLLEAGGPDRAIWISIPAGFTKLMNSSTYNWHFKTEPESYTHDRQIPIPRGRTLGGTSAINGMLVVRGQPLDYDSWAQAGNPGWSWAEVLPYFKKFESFAGPNDGSRGTTGPVSVHEYGFRNELTLAALKAAQNEGIPGNRDYNSGRQEGFGYLQINQRRGVRVSAAAAYLDPIRNRSNLRIETHAQVSRLIFEGKRCVGVEYIHSGQKLTIRANRVVLSAGAVQSPQVLELSGIGRPDVLGAAGIDVVHALPGVGENLRDHYAPRLKWRVKQAVTFNERSRGLPLAWEILKYFTKREGLLAVPASGMYGFAKSRPCLAAPDVQISFHLASYSTGLAKRMLDHEPGMTWAVYQLRPDSTGSIHISTSDPLAAPKIRPRFLSQDSDRRALVDGMKLTRRIVENRALDAFRGLELSPGANVKSYDEWLDFARGSGETAFHVCGTCKMGRGDDAVVDHELKVHGIENLYVVDASIMPTMISGNTNAPTLMIAEKASDLLRN